MAKDKNRKNQENDDRSLVLHLKYWIGILAGAVVLLICAHTGSNFMDEFSFASTITSIVLSVVAILLSFIGENKTQELRDKISQEGDTITKTAEEMTQQYKNLANQVGVIIKSQKNIEKKLILNKDDIEENDYFVGDSLLNPSVVIHEPSNEQRMNFISGDKQ